MWTLIEKFTPSVRPAICQLPRRGSLAVLFRAILMLGKTTAQQTEGPPVPEEKVAAKQSEGAEPLTEAMSST